MSHSSTRQSNIELLRIIAILMIIGHHLSVHGVETVMSTTTPYQIWASGSFINKIFVCLFQPGGEVGVAIFFIITGYFQIKRDHFSLAKTIMECIFYGILSIIVLIVCQLALNIDILATQDDFINYIVSALFTPSTSRIWWFITAYILLMLISPFLNKMLRKLNRKGLLVTIFSIWFLYYVVFSYISAPYLDIGKAVLFYCIGSYIQLSPTQSKAPVLSCTLAIIGWLLFSICVYGLGYIATQSTTSFVSLGSTIFKLLATSIAVPLCAYNLFKLFNSIDLGSNNIINKLASTVFGVYLIHDSTPGRVLIWQHIFRVQQTQYTSKYFPIMAIGTILVIWLVCTIIDLIRINTIEKLALKSFKKISDNFKNKFYTNK